MIEVFACVVAIPLDPVDPFVQSIVVVVVTPRLNKRVIVATPIDLDLWIYGISKASKKRAEAQGKVVERWQSHRRLAWPSCCRITGIASIGSEFSLTWLSLLDLVFDPRERERERERERARERERGREGERRVVSQEDDSYVSMPPGPSCVPLFTASSADGKLAVDPSYPTSCRRSMCCSQPSALPRSLSRATLWLRFRTRKGQTS